MQYEDWEFHPSRLPEDKHEREKWLEKLQEKFHEEIVANPKVADFLKPYHPSSGESFLKQYAVQKRQLVAYSKFRLEQAERRQLRFRDETEDAYKAIFQKKLFNLMLQWRADQIALPDIELMIDFDKWVEDAKHCPFLEPVQAEEIDLMQRFLQTDDCELDRFTSLSVYSFSEILDQDKADSHDSYPEMPAWFSYYDTYMGTGHLLLLPDVRGVKEEYYRNRYFEEYRASHPPYVPPPGHDLPFPDNYSPELHYKLAKLLDDEIFQDLFYNQWQEAADKEKAEEAAGIYDAEEYVLHLENIPDPPPVRGGVSWREALHYCYTDYLKRVVSEDLPMVWEEDKFYRETGLSEAHEIKDDESGLEKLWREQILRGRELAGEPRDLNF